MKNKKFLCLVLALVMVLGAFGPVFAETKAADKKEDKKEETVKVEKVTGKDAKVQWLVDHKVVEGRKVNEDPKDNDLALDKMIKRSEITKLLIYAIGQQDLAKKVQGVKIYSDVEASHWANGVINVGTTMGSPANDIPFLKGYPDRTFKPDRDVTYAELAKMLVVLVKEDLTQAKYDDALNNGWPAQWITWAAELGILDDVKIEDANKPAVRNDAFVMLYNALYKLTDLRQLISSETLGIISEASANKLVINQGDKKVEYTVDAKTNFVTGLRTGVVNPIVAWGEVVKSNDTYYLGSLVRVLANDKGVVTHIVQLGNPKVGLVNNEGKNNVWERYAEKTIETEFKFHDNGTIDLSGKTAKFYDKKLVFKEGTKEQVVLNLNNQTRYFAADYAKGQLTELKDKNAALELLEKNCDNCEKEARHVYAGFDVLPNTERNEAKIIVLNLVDKDNSDGKLVRVITPGSSKHQLQVENPAVSKAKSEEEVVDLRDYKFAFPVDYGFEKYDVIDLTKGINGYAGELVIDHSDTDNFPILKVTKVETRKVDGLDTTDVGYVKELTLTDGKGEAKVDVALDTDYFFADEVKVGAFVQVRFIEEDDDVLVNRVDVISVVPGPMKGELPELVVKEDLRTVKGTIENVEAGHTKDRMTFTIIPEDSQYPVRYVAATQALIDAEIIVLNPKDDTKVTVNKDKVEFLADLATKYAEYNVPFAYNFKNISVISGAKAVQAKIDALADAPNLDETAIQEARDAYNDLDADAQALVDDTKLVDREHKVKAAKEAIKVEADKVTDDKLDVTADAFSAAENKSFDDLKGLVESKLAPANGVTVTSVVLDVEDGSAKLVQEAEAQTVNADVTYTKDGVEVTRTIEVSYQVNA